MLSQCVDEDAPWKAGSYLYYYLSKVLFVLVKSMWLDHSTGIMTPLKNTNCWDKWDFGKKEKKTRSQLDSAFMDFRRYCVNSSGISGNTILIREEREHERLSFAPAGGLLRLRLLFATFRANFNYRRKSNRIVAGLLLCSIKSTHSIYSIVTLVYIHYSQ